MPLMETDLNETNLSLKVPNGTFVTGTKVPKWQGGKNGRKVYF